MAIDTYKCTDDQCMEIYTVKTGDTLYAIAQAYGIPVAHLMQVNRILNPYHLRPGEKLCIPVKNPADPQVPARPDTPILPTPVICDGRKHTIARGDTLYMIAKLYGVTLDALMQANPSMDPYNLRVGDTICVPMQNTPGGNNPGNGNGNGNGNGRPNMPSCFGGRAYATQRGDTLTRILNRFNLSYGQLLAANPDIDFTGSLEGLTLCIPMEEDPNGCMETYTVQRGDTIDTISERYLMISDRLVMANPELTVKDFSKAGTPICIPK